MIKSRLKTIQKPRIAKIKMDSQWAPVFSSTFQPKAELIRQRLESEGIPALIENLQDSAHVHIGELTVFVKRENVVQAKYLLTQWENE